MSGEVQADRICPDLECREGQWQLGEPALETRMGKCPQKWCKDSGKCGTSLGWAVGAEHAPSSKKTPKQIRSCAWS